MKCGCCVCVCSLYGVKLDRDRKKAPKAKNHIKRPLLADCCKVFTAKKFNWKMGGMPCLLFLIHSSWLWHFRCSLFNQIFVLPINFFTKPIKRCVQNRTGPFPLLLLCSLLLPWISAFASLSKVKKKRAVSIKYTTKSLPKNEIVDENEFEQEKNRFDNIHNLIIYA